MFTVGKQACRPLWAGVGVAARKRYAALYLVDLSLHLPSPLPQVPVLVFAYLQWLIGQRNVSLQTQGLAVRAFLAAAKYLYASQDLVGHGYLWMPHHNKHIELLEDLVRWQQTSMFVANGCG